MNTTITVHESSIIANSTNQSGKNLECDSGTFLPVWEPQLAVAEGTIALRGTIYLLSMYYLFVGIAYVADKFMAAIEMITSTKKEVQVKDDNGVTQVVEQILI